MATTKAHLYTVLSVALGISFFGEGLLFAGGQGSYRDNRRHEQNEYSRPRRSENLVINYLLQDLNVEDPATFSLSLKLKAKLEKLSQGPESLRASFSENSAATLGEIFRAFGRTEYSNAIVLGPAGSGKTFLLDQLTALFALGVYPDFLMKELGLDPATGEGKSFEVLREAFLGKTDVVMINMDLLSHDNTKQGKAFSSEEVRMRTLLTGLFSAARKEFQRPGGRRTIFVFDEVATLPALVQTTLKKILDETGFRNPKDAAQRLADPGYMVLAMTTPDEYRRMVQGDSAVERRYKKVLLKEPSEAEAFKIVRSKSDREWTSLYEVAINDKAIEFLIRMRRMLNRPPLAMPASVLAATNDLFLWKMQTGGQGGEITLKDAQDFLMQRSSLSDLWFEGPNGEPPFHDLESRIKSRVIGQDEVIEKITERLKTWARLGFGGEVPVFFLGGPSGSGKDTLIKAINEVLFNHNGHHLMFNIGGIGGFGIEAIIEGPPRGNHADGEPGLLSQAIESGMPEGAIAFNEGKDTESAQLEKLKVFIENGEIRPRGQDSRTRPILFPMFIVGQWGEEYFAGLPDDAAIDKMYERLSQAEVEQAFLTGKEGRPVGAVSRALLDRAKKTGGVFVLKPVARALFPKIVELLVKKGQDKLQAAKNIKFTVTDSLRDFIAKTSAEAGEGPRGLGAATIDFTEAAISRAMDEGLPHREVEVALDLEMRDGRARIVVAQAGRSSAPWSFDALKLRTAKTCERLLTEQ